MSGPLFSLELGLPCPGGAPAALLDLEALLNRLPVGIAVFDRDLVLCRCNRTWAEYADRCALSVTHPVEPGTQLFDLFPGNERDIAPLLERVMAGETARLEGLCSESGGVLSYRDVIWTPLIENGQVVGIVEVSVDATERVLARRTLEQRVAERTQELSALYDVMAAASASLDLEMVMERSLERVLAVMGCEIGAIHLLDETGKSLRLAVSRGLAPDVVPKIASVPVENGLAGWAIELGEPVIVPKIADTQRPLYVLPALGEQAYVGVPMYTRERRLGVLSVVGKAGRQFNEREVALLSSIADRIGVAVEHAQLYAQADQLAMLRERQRLARELHDSVTQSLYSLVLVAEAGRRLADAGDLGRVTEALARLGEIGQQTLKEMRLLVYELRPLSLQSEGLVKALQQRLETVEKRAGVRASLTVEGPLELSGATEEELFRVVQEALNNALKHAAATSVVVQIRADGGRVTIDVVDDGRGFDLAAASGGGGMGLANMQERMEKLGGVLTILSAPGKGTTVSMILDIAQPVAARD